MDTVARRAEQGEMSGDGTATGTSSRPGRDRLLAALDVAGMGAWELDLRTGLVRAAAATDRLFGLPPDDNLRAATAYFARIHPDDRPRAEEAVRRTVEEGAEHAVEYRVVLPDGTIRWLASRGALERDAVGEPVSLYGAVIDVTARREAEAALREREAHLQLALTAARMVAWEWDPGRDAIITTENVREIYGVPSLRRAEDGAALVHPDDAERHAATVRAAAANASGYHSEFRIIRPDTGATVWLEERGVAVLDESGALRKLTGVVMDVTERKETEAALRAGERRLRLITDALPALISYVDAEMRYQFNNRTYEEWFGHPREEVAGRTMREVLGEAAYELLRPFAERALAGEQVTYERALPYKDGGTRWVQVTYVPAVAGDGSVEGFYVLVNDIGERKRAEDERVRLLDAERAARAEAEAAAARTARLQAATAALAAALTPEEVARAVAREGVAAFGAAASNVYLLDEAGEALILVAADQYPDDYFAPYRRRPLSGSGPSTDAVRAGQPIILATAAEWAARYPDLAAARAGSGLEAAITMPLIGGSRVEGTLSLSFAGPREFADADLALLRALGQGAAQALERARLYAAERAARAAAEEAVRARDTFLSIAAHELRTPVTSLKGTAQLLLRQQGRGQLDPDRLARALTGLDRSADRLTGLTADLLDVSRIRTGQLPLTLRPTDLAALVREAVARVRERDDTRHQLTLDSPPALAPILADAGRIDQVLANLLDNATKYSPDGGEIVVTLRAEGDGASISVRDQGIGLPPGAVETIFEPFGRAANAVDSQLPGMGLGLYISRSIVERHGGRIRAESPGEGRGMTVTIWLPFAPAT